MGCLKIFWVIGKKPQGAYSVPPPHRLKGFKQMFGFQNVPGFIFFNESMNESGSEFDPPQSQSEKKCAKFWNVLIAY